MDIYFETGNFAPNYSRALAERIREIDLANQTDHRIVSREEDAELVCYLESSQCWLSNSWLQARYPIYFRRPESTIIWDFSDAPIFFLPGLYASLDRNLLGRNNCYMGGAYFWKYNHYVDERPFAEARFLLGFRGSRSSRLRSRIATHFESMQSELVDYAEVCNSHWSTILVRDESEAKRCYAASLGHSKFQICPRGNGLNSIRLFEVMQSGRVPVIISDRLVLPPGPKWEDFSIRIPERAICEILPRIQALEFRWEEMAQQARESWELWFADEVLLDTIAGLGRAVMDRRPVRPRRVVRAKIASGLIRLRRALARAAGVLLR